MALVWKVGALCTMGAICALALRRYVPELSLLLAIVTVGAAIIMLSDLLGEVAWKRRRIWMSPSPARSTGC